jgi:hypothetical protein
MIKVFLLMFNSSAAWEKIAQARRGFAYIIAVQLLPLMLLGCGLEAWGLKSHGKFESRYQIYKNFPHEAIAIFEVAQILLFIALVFGCAVMVFKISQTFLERLTFLQVFTTIAYGLSPLFLLHCLDAGARVHPAFPWLLGMAFAVWVLYQGIPRVMQPDPTHAFGVYLSTIMVVVLSSLTVRIMTAMYLLGYMDFEHSWLAIKISQLLGH